MNRITLHATLLALFILPAASAETLTDVRGRTITAELLSMPSPEEIRVKVRGKVHVIPLVRLDEESKGRIERWQEDRRANQRHESERVNEAIGHPLFGPGALWEEAAKEVAARLDWPLEGATKLESSYRSYPGADYRILGARPYSAALFADAGSRVTRVAVMFANKGDRWIGPRASTIRKRGEIPRSREFDERLEEDFETLQENLQEAIGQGRKDFMGRQAVWRWDWSGHAILLTHVEHEFVRLEVVPTAFADDDCRAPRIADEVIKKRMAANVVRSANGDVVIDNIPMVDQGPKGYCSPATFERAMRYAGVPADMYELATLATRPGGGTVTSWLYEEARSQIWRKGRRPKEIEFRRLKLKDVTRYIDLGVPIIWNMSALKLYVETSRQRTRERDKVSDWSAYTGKISLDAVRNAKAWAGNKTNAHTSMIRGYNRQTREVAVSDSWGEWAALRWVHVEEAAAVASGEAFVIMW